MDITEIREMVHMDYPDMTVVNLSEYEDEISHQTYCYLYESLKNKYEELTEEFHTLRNDYENLEKENIVISDANEKLKKSNHDFLNMTKGFMDSINVLIEKDIIVSNVKAMDKNGDEIVATSDQRKDNDILSDYPGVYDFGRCSWFTELDKEFSKLEAAKKVAKNTQNGFTEKLTFWKRLSKKINEEEITYKAADKEVVEKRKSELKKLLSSKLSNEEKYLKYILLTPGISKEYMKTLLGASELAINANVLIELLEQPQESFNKEVIEAYVSKARKGTEYNLKKELANELISGEWYVSSEINGKPVKFQLLPIDIVNDIKEKINTIINTLADIKNTNESDNKTSGYDMEISLDDNDAPSLTDMEDIYYTDDMEEDFTDEYMDDISF